MCRRAEAAGLTRDQLDLVLIGAVMSLLNTNERTFDKNHKCKGRQRIYSNYLFGGQYVCRRTFQFLVGVGKDRLQAIKASYMESGLTTRIHGNTKRLPHNVTCYEGIQKIVTFVTNFAEEQAILLPGRIPGYKKDDFKLLPSSTSKKVKCVYNWHTNTKCHKIKFNINSPVTSFLYSKYGDYTVNAVKQADKRKLRTRHS